MSKESKLTPNTHLGAVTWWRDMHFGSLLYVCQGMLGFDPNDKNDYHFINSKKHSVDKLWEFFKEEKLENGNLALELYSDDWHSIVLATIETTLPFDESVPDQVFLNLIADFIEHVRGLPLGKPGDDPYTDEEMAEACEHAAAFMGPIYEGLAQEGHTVVGYSTENKDDEDDIPS